eukprot:TRINITY_DN16710_c0_g1_i1.p3 TRINITY_DN16710_c0_g1~~TRINITY_DN16710_c0_g1_i1.p3  ORF type:complete len:209 (+),score=12.19 TRINITY_DN16710_c0_g1_i1:642-1268(+)
MRVIQCIVNPCSGLLDQFFVVEREDKSQSKSEKANKIRSTHYMLYLLQSEKVDMKQKDILLNRKIFRIVQLMQQLREDVLSQREQCSSQFYLQNIVGLNLVVCGYLQMFQLVLVTLEEKIIKNYDNLSKLILVGRYRWFSWLIIYELKRGVYLIYGVWLEEQIFVWSNWGNSLQWTNASVAKPLDFNVKQEKMLVYCRGQVLCLLCIQ